MKTKLWVGLSMAIVFIFLIGVVVIGLSTNNTTVVAVTKTPDQTATVVDKTTNAVAPNTSATVTQDNAQQTTQNTQPMMNQPMPRRMTRAS